LDRICRSAARGCRRLGLDAHFRPRNDIEVDGRKISGTGGTVIQGGAMFQGTVLVKNRIEVFLRALRVPVEKLKKREIDSLMERLAFVEDLLGRELDLAELKQALAVQFAQELGLELYPGDLGADEQAEVDQRLPYFESEEWVYGRQRAEREPAWLRSIQQSEGGVLRVRLWLDRTGRLVQKAFISGDFFCRPQRLVLDLEAALLGARANPEGLYRLVHDFLTQYPGEIAGVPIKEVAGAVAGASRRTCLAKDFAALEAADLFFVGMQPDDLHGLDLRWLLLPYCSKPVDCDLRLVADCDVCGQCQFTPMYELAEEIGITPVSIQSFEHLMEALAVAREKGGDFVGSCCEAFYSKHQREMEESGTKGVLINLDSTTCYDLGKGMEAYVGRFDHQTEMNTDLIEKVVRTIVNS
jgi:lipoate-protein ligase A